MRIVEVGGKKILIRTRRKFHVFLVESFSDYTYIMAGPREEFEFIRTFFPHPAFIPSFIRKSTFSWGFFQELLKISLSGVPDDGSSSNSFIVSGHLDGTEEVFKELRKHRYRALIGNVIR